jgi:hypothetical protein
MNGSPLYFPEDPTLAFVNDHGLMERRLMEMISLESEKGRPTARRDLFTGILKLSTEHPLIRERTRQIVAQYDADSQRGARPRQVEERPPNWERPDPPITARPFRRGTDSEDSSPADYIARVLAEIQGEESPSIPPAMGETLEDSPSVAYRTVFGS